MDIIPNSIELGTSKNAIVFIGLPGSGKTTYIRNSISGYNIVSADTIKEAHPEYSDANPSTLHEWSVIEAEVQMEILSNCNLPICMDSGGVNNSYSLRIINMLKSKGYQVTLIHMDTPLSVCLERNRSRARHVPEEAIIEKSKRINQCAEKQKKIVDSYLKIEYNETTNLSKVIVH